MKPQDIKLFKDQPPISNRNITELLKRGLITAFKNAQGKPHHNRPGWVVGYTLLTKAISSGEVSQIDARRLLAIEVAATNGKPRQTHLDRLMSPAYAEDKSSVLANIEKYRV